MITLNHVLITYKKSTYQKYVLDKKDDGLIDLIQKKDPTTKRLVQAHDAHLKALDRVQSFFVKKSIPFKVQHRSKVFSEKKYDLIISVGGDGTFLDAARQLIETSLLGVNSSPKDSVGRFCATPASGFSSFFNQFLDGKIKPALLSRLDVTLEGKKLAPVLNDVLVCNLNPAMTARYMIEQGGKKEDQKSSGIWVSTAAGSTAAIKGAGGKVLKVVDSRFQFAVRELYHQPHQRFYIKGKLLDASAKVTVFSKMKKGYIFLDGSDRKKLFSYGTKLVVTGLGPKLKTWHLSTNT